MKRIFSYSLILFLLASLFPLQSQDLIKNSSVTGVCYAGNKTTRIYIPPPDKFLKKGDSKVGGTITFIYSGFSSKAITAMEYAGSILESMLPADTKITVTANMLYIASTGVLANSSATGFAAGWAIDALNPLAYYPVALAEKIAGESLNDDMSGDIVLNVNSSIGWYLGTDGNTAVNAYDLVTVVLHELCHGLGFFDSMNTNSTIGWYGYDSIPMIYDTFVENLAGKGLTDTLKFENYSAPLRNELIGGRLYFDGPLLKTYTSGKRGKLYVPSVWDPGSSVAHLDEDSTYFPNTLMTPFIDRAEAIHNPGDYTFSILGDLGWVNTSILHKPLKDTEEHLTDITLSVKIKSDTLYNRDNVGLVYSFDSFISSDTLYLSSLNSDNEFSINVNIPDYNSEFQYYLFVEDYFSRIYRSPSLNEVFKYKTYIGTDTVKPLITHVPLDTYLETVDTLTFNAVITDNIGIDTAYIEYIVNDGEVKQMGLMRGSGDKFSEIFVFKNENLIGGDSVQYRIVAIDSAMLPNTAISPKSGYYTIHIEKLETVLESYSTDFSDAEDDFFKSGFDIVKPAGFSGKALHTKHPYFSPEDNDKSINYTAILKHPLKFNESGMLFNFREIVLVEPGDPGSVFGSDDFFDYVIVEGSGDFGKTWFSLIDGYDSRVEQSWLDLYNNTIVDINSLYEGTESNYLKRTIFYKPSEYISAGDTMLLRFRLFSDPFANGWGWAIEDLQINPLVDAVEDIAYIPLKIFPNPGSGIIQISMDESGINSIKPFRFRIFNSSGVCVIDNRSSGLSGTLADISDQPSGFYFILIYLDDGIKSIKYSLIK